MANKKEEAGDCMNQLTSSKTVEDSCDRACLCEDYVHDPEEFIDIHGSHPNKTSCCTKNIGKAVSPEYAVDPHLEEENLPLTDKDNNFVHSASGFSAIQNLKVPVQVSEESERSSEVACEVPTKLCCSSDDEYESADEGQECSGRAENAEEGEADEIGEAEAEDSDEDFLPVEDENNKSTYCGHEDISETNNDFDNDKEEDETQIIDDMQIRQKLEDSYTEEEKQAKRDLGQSLKDDGNSKFRNGDYDEAIRTYSEALEICPLNFLKERSIMFSNRAACKMKKELYTSAIEDCSSALDLHSHYIKALLRRAELYEKVEKLDEALKDYQKAVELDPSLHSARAACIKLAEQIKERNEKMKDEMIGKLKDLGNLVLRPFGLSVNNFNLQQDPSTGSYSVQFQQNPSKNGS